jgi:cytochrome o ubiquinol oxidase subunit 2
MNILDSQGPIEATEQTILPAIFGFAFWVRASKAGVLPLADRSYSGRIERVVGAVPAFTTILLGGVAWIGARQLDSAAPVRHGAMLR